MTANLYELKEALWDIVNQAPETDEELEGWQELAFAELGEAFEDKIDSCCAMVRQLEGEAKYIKEEAKRMADRAKSAANRAERLKTYMRDMIMDRPKVADKKGVEKHEVIKTAHFTARVQQSPLTIDKDKVDLVAAEDVGLVDFLVPNIHVADALAKMKASNGEIPAGFENAVKEGGWSLRIK